MKIETPHRNLVVLHLIVLNASALAFLGWAYAAGLLQWLFSFETTGIGYGLVALTVIAITGIFRSAFKVSAAYESIKANVFVDTRKMLILAGYIGMIAKLLMFIGLWANSLGILISFSVIDFSSTDTILASVAGMWSGLKIAFSNTLISLGLYMAVFVNLHALTTATRLLMIYADDMRARIDG